MVPEISATEAHARFTSAHPPRLIDVREADEWALARIPGAELLPLSQWPAIALEKLTNLAGGIEAWSSEVDPAVPRY